MKFVNLTAVAGACWRWEDFKQQFEIRIEKNDADHAGFDSHVIKPRSTVLLVSKTRIKTLAQRVFYWRPNGFLVALVYRHYVGHYLIVFFADGPN